MRPALADDTGDVVLAVAELLHKRLVAHGLFERIEIGALNVLDDGELERFAVVNFKEDHRHVVDAGALRRPPPPLTGNDFVRIGYATHGPRQDRLDDTAL